MEDLQSKHRKEQSELQGRITQKKKNTTKKTRKGVNDECDRLQKELQDRQQAEVDAVSGHVEKHDTNSLLPEEEQTQEEVGVARRDATTIATPADHDPSCKTFLATQEVSRKPNRQKARLARRTAEQECQAAQAAEEASKLPDLRKQEMAEMQKHFEKLGLEEVPIRPDGHCMYSAVGILLQEIILDRGKFKAGELLSYQAVRANTARFISQHPTDFEPFLEEPIDHYTNKIKNTSEWGGQLELQAIARAYAVNINVLQADGRVEKIESGLGPETNQIWLTYYRHSFGLGEHYNALKKGP